MHFFPDLGRTRPFDIARTEIRLVQFVGIMRYPGAEVHAVGDTADRNLIHIAIRPDIVPHRASNFTM